MTQLILYTSEDGNSVIKESFTTHTESGPAVSNHFRGITKMVVHSKGGRREVKDEASFPDQAILYTACRDLSWSPLRLDSSATVKDFLIVQIEGVWGTSGHMVADQFRGVTKLIGLGHNRRVAA